MQLTTVGNGIGLSRLFRLFRLFLLFGLSGLFSLFSREPVGRAKPKPQNPGGDEPLPYNSLVISMCCILGFVGAGFTPARVCEGSGLNIKRLFGLFRLSGLFSLFSREPVGRAKPKPQNPGGDEPEMLYSVYSVYFVYSVYLVCSVCLV